MAPLYRYYLSFAGMLALGLGIAALPPGNGQTAGGVVLLSLGAYMVFVRCPNCGADLSKVTG